MSLRPSRRWTKTRSVRFDDEVSRRAWWEPGERRTVDKFDEGPTGREGQVAEGVHFKPTSGECANGRLRLAGGTATAGRSSGPSCRKSATRLWCVSSSLTTSIKKTTLSMNARTRPS